MSDRMGQPCWVVAVVRDDGGNILLCRDAQPAEWDLPSGVLALGEDVPSALRRVVAEKATIGISVGWLTGIHSHIHEGLTLVFSARQVLGRVHPHGLTRQCRWVQPGVALQILGRRRGEQLRVALEQVNPQPVVITQVSYQLEAVGTAGHSTN